MKVLQIDSNGNIVAEWTTPTEAANSGGFDSSHIAKCLKGKRSSHGGFVWKWSETTSPDIDPTVEQKSYDYNGDKAVLTAKTRKSLTSLQEALEFFEVDTDKWEAERYIINSWDVTNKLGKTYTNYQVKVYLKEKKKKLEEILVDVNRVLGKVKPKKIVNINTGQGIISAEISDLHIGANIKDLVRTPDFSIEILVDYLHTVVDVINSYNADAVVLNMHGDFFESISGLNHLNSFQGIKQGMYGASVIIFADHLLSDNLISRINNLKKINMISGNHDRLTPSKEVDAKGEGAAILAYMLQKSFPDIPVEHNPLIICTEIDGIWHIKTHGHHGISKKHASKVVNDYGKTGMYSMWTEGHFHSLEMSKTLRKQLVNYEDVEIISMDELKYRKVRLSPLFTGNFFQESVGYGGTAGVMVDYNNGKGYPIIHEYTI